MRDSPGKIDHREKNKHESLHKTDKETEKHDRHRYEERNEAEKYCCYKMVTGDVTKKSEA